jgi:SAM-dependent methyltransferase
VAFVISRLWERSVVYRLWQLPFERRKFAPVARALSRRPVESVLDVGCGPGTNARHFRNVRYVGIDLNPAYIRTARRRFGDVFVVGDAAHELPTRGAPYDLVLVNSLLHHLDDAQVAAVIRNATGLLASNGVVHILDLEFPSGPGIARFLALHDRGDFVRTRDRWRTLLDGLLRIDRYDPYPLGVAGWTLWNMFHVQGAAPT